MLFILMNISISFVFNVKQVLSRSVSSVWDLTCIQTREPLTFLHMNIRQHFSSFEVYL